MIGAGILSSSGELQYSVKSPDPQQIALDLLRAMRTRYKIDSHQQLFDMTMPDFTPLYEELNPCPSWPPTRFCRKTRQFSADTTVQAPQRHCIAPNVSSGRFLLQNEEVNICYTVYDVIPLD